MKEVKKINVSVRGINLFFIEIFIKAKITRGGRYCKLKAKEILGSIIPLEIKDKS